MGTSEKVGRREMGSIARRLSAEKAKVARAPSLFVLLFTTQKGEEKRKQRRDKPFSRNRKKGDIPLHFHDLPYLLRGEEGKSCRGRRRGAKGRKKKRKTAATLYSIAGEKKEETLEGEARNGKKREEKTPSLSLLSPSSG